MSDADVAAQLRAIADQLDPSSVAATTVGVPAVLAPQDAPGAGVIDPGFLNKENTDPASWDGTEHRTGPADRRVAQGVSPSGTEQRVGPADRRVAVVASPSPAENVPAAGPAAGAAHTDAVVAATDANTQIAATPVDQRPEQITKAQADIATALSTWPDSVELQDAKAQLDLLASETDPTPA